MAKTRSATELSNGITSLEEKVADLDKRLTKEVNDSSQKIFERLDALDKRLVALDKLRRDIEDLKVSVEFSAAETVKVREELKVLSGSITELRKENTVLKQNQLNLTKVVQELRYNLEEMECISRASNIVIRNVISADNKLAVKEIVKIGTVANIQVNENDIIECKVFPSKVQGQCSIKVVFAKEEKRDIFFEAVKRMRLTTRKLGYAGNDIPIYVSDDLSSYGRSLFAKMRKFKHDRNWKYVWSKKGKLFLKEKDDGRAIVIKKEEDLLRL